MTISIVVTESVALTKTKAAQLPAAPVQYDRQYHDALTNILRQYFNTLDNFVGQLTLSAGGTGEGVYLPNGSFQSSQTQTAGNTTTAYAITFDTTDYSNGVTLESGSHLKAAYKGRYNLQFSVQLENTTNATQDIDIWVRRNGDDFDSSNSRFGLSPRKTSTDPFHVVGSLNVLVDLQAGDYVELAWCTTDAVSYTHLTLPTNREV